MVVGYLMQTVEGIYLDRIALLISAIGAVLGCGLLLALWIQHRLRRTLLDLEPETIVNRFVLQELVLEHISEGDRPRQPRPHPHAQQRRVLPAAPARHRSPLPAWPAAGGAVAAARPALTQLETELGFTVHGESFIGRWQAVEARSPVGC